jgi:phosphoserine phosphatase RsbU/P
MPCQAEQDPDHDGSFDVAGDEDTERVAFSGLLEDSAEDLYENAPCGYLSTLLDGRIAKINTTLLRWLGRQREELVGRARFADLLTVGGKLYHETHFAPLLQMHGAVGGIALDMVTSGGARLPVLVTSAVKTGPDGQPLLIRTTVFDARDRRAYEQELLRARQDADRERDRAQALAATLQRTLLPPALPVVPGLQVAAYYHPASPDEIGGDFYDLFPMAENRWGVFLGDVCGKGADAAALTSLARYTLRAAAVHDTAPVAVLNTLNTVLNQEHHSGPHFCTVLFGVLSATPSGYTVVLAGGGHPPALLLQANGAVAYQPTPGGMLVGAFPDATFIDTTIRLATGDTLLLYTDGLTEARTHTTDGRFEEEALLEFTAAIAPTTAPGAVAAVTTLLAELRSGLDDDVAVLAISVPPRDPPNESDLPADPTRSAHV